MNALGLVALATITVGAASIPWRTSSTETDPFHNAYVAPSVQPTCGFCASFVCADAGNQHSFVYYPDIPQNFGLDHSCISYEGGGCPHPLCGGLADNTPGTLEPELLALPAALADGDFAAARAVRRLLDRFPGRVELNTERSAIQVTASCSKNVIVSHVPLNPAVVAAALTPTLRQVTGQ